MKKDRVHSQSRNHGLSLDWERAGGFWLLCGYKDTPALLQSMACLSASGEPQLNIKCPWIVESWAEPRLHLDRDAWLRKEFADARGIVLWQIQPDAGAALHLDFDSVLRRTSQSFLRKANPAAAVQLQIKRLEVSAASRKIKVQSPWTWCRLMRAPGLDKRTLFAKHHILFRPPPVATLLPAPAYGCATAINVFTGRCFLLRELVASV